MLKTKKKKKMENQSFETYEMLEIVNPESCSK